MSHALPQPRTSGDAANPHLITVPGRDRQYDRRRILLVLLIALAMSLVQVSSVNVALPAIQSGIGASSTQLQWVLSGYALALGILLVPSGRLGDIMGRSEVFAVGLAIFALASSACALVDDANMLNLLRVLQGAGAALFSPQVTGMIQQYFLGQARAKAFSLFGFVISVSVAVGPLLSGGLISWLGPQNGWRWSFLINLPLGLIGVIAALAWMPLGTGMRAARAPGERSRIDLDPVGMVLLSSAVLGVMLPFMVHGSPWIWATLPAAVVLGIAWVLWERRYEAAGRLPMVRLRLFAIRSFSYCTAASVLQFLGVTSVFALVAIYAQQGLGITALVAAMLGLPNAVASAISSLWAGRYAISHGRGLQVLSLVIIAVGVLGAAVAALRIIDGHSIWWLAVGFAVQGIGQGMMGSVNQTQAMIDVPADRGGIAGGVMQTVQRMATAVGNAMLTGIFFRIVGDFETATVTDWSHGIAWTYLVVVGIMLAAIAVAVAYWRSGRRGAPHEAVPA